MQFSVVQRKGVFNSVRSSEQFIVVERKGKCAVQCVLEGWKV